MIGHWSRGLDEDQSKPGSDEVSQWLKSRFVAHRGTIAPPAFAPDWKAHVATTGSQPQIRARLPRYWSDLVRDKFGFTAYTADLISGPQRQPLYWLMLLTRNELGEKLWKATLKATP